MKTQTPARFHLPYCGRWCVVWPSRRTSWDGIFQIIQGPSATSSTPLSIKVPLADKVIIVSSAVPNTHVPTMLPTFRSQNAEDEAMLRASLIQLGYPFTRYVPPGVGKIPKLIIDRICGSNGSAASEAPVDLQIRWVCHSEDLTDFPIQQIKKNYELSHLSDSFGISHFYVKYY